MPILTTSVQHSCGKKIQARAIREIKEMRHSDWKKEIKLYCFADYMDIYVENTKDSTKNFCLKIV